VDRVTGVSGSKYGRDLAAFVDGVCRQGWWIGSWRECWWQLVTRVVPLAAYVARQCWVYGVVGGANGFEGGGGCWCRAIDDVACCLEPLASAIVVIGMWLGTIEFADGRKAGGRGERRRERIG